MRVITPKTRYGIELAIEEVAELDSTACLINELINKMKKHNCDCVSIKSNRTFYTVDELSEIFEALNDLQYIQEIY